MLTDFHNYFTVRLSDNFAIKVDQSYRYGFGGLAFWATVCKTVHPMLSVRCLSVRPYVCHTRALLRLSSSLIGGEMSCRRNVHVVGEVSSRRNVS